MRRCGRGAGDVGARVDLHRDAPPRLAYRSRLSLGTSGSSGGSSGSSMVPGRDDAPRRSLWTRHRQAEPDADSSGPKRARGAFQGLVLPWGIAHTASRTTHARSFVMVLAKGKLGDPKDPAGVVKFERPVRRALRRDLTPASFRHFRGLHRHLAARRRLIPPPRPIRRNSSMMRSRPTCGRSALSSSASSASP